MTTFEPDDDSPGGTQHTTWVNLDFLVNTILEYYCVRPDAPCGCKPADFHPTYLECEHGNIIPFTGSSRFWDREPGHFDVARGIASIDALTNANSVGEWLKDHYDQQGWVHVISVLTPKQAKKKAIEDRRQALEQAAGEFAAKHHVKPGTFDFIRAVKKAIRRVERERDTWNDGETRMEQWAAHMYCGSREAYFDDLNFENGRYASRLDNLRGILEWLDEACPLLMASYRERKLSRKKRKV
jgi:hypothetical protein